jgi:hypothetical protein
VPSASSLKSDRARALAAALTANHAMQKALIARLGKIHLLLQQVAERRVILALNHHLLSTDTCIIVLISLQRAIQFYKTSQKVILPFLSPLRSICLINCNVMTIASTTSTNQRKEINIVTILC